MVFQFYFKRMPSSEALKSMSERKLLDVIERFTGNSGLVRVTFSSEKAAHKIHCSFRGNKGTVLHASAAGENMYAIIDTVAQRVEAQLSRQKMRLRQRFRYPLGHGRALKLVDETPSLLDSNNDWQNDIYDAYDPYLSQRYIQ